MSYQSYCGSKRQQGMALLLQAMGAFKHLNTDLSLTLPQQIIYGSHLVTYLYSSRVSAMSLLCRMQSVRWTYSGQVASS